MFNMLDQIPQLFVLSLIGFFVTYTIRHAFISKAIYILLYHVSLFIILFIWSIGGGSVINDAYTRLEQFKLLEQNNQLTYAKNHPQSFDSMLQIDLKQFENSSEFENYIKTEYEHDVDRAEAISIGWLYVLFTELSILLNYVLHRKLAIPSTCKNRLTKKGR